MTKHTCADGSRGCPHHLYASHGCSHCILILDCVPSSMKNWLGLLAHCQVLTLSLTLVLVPHTDTLPHKYSTPMHPWRELQHIIPYSGDYLWRKDISFLFLFLELLLSRATWKIPSSHHTLYCYGTHHAAHNTLVHQTITHTSTLGAYGQTQSAEAMHYITWGDTH